MDIIELENVDDFELHESVELIQEFKSLLARDWTIQVVWISKDKNVYADYFIKHALNTGPGLCLFTRE